jgi:hypothetical protein
LYKISRLELSTNDVNIRFGPQAEIAKEDALETPEDDVVVEEEEEAAVEAPETYVDAPSNVTANEGEEFTIEIRIEHLPPECQFPFLMSHFTSRNGDTPSQLMAPSYPKIAGFTYPEGSVTEIVIECTLVDIINVTGIPNTIVEIPPPPTKGSIHPGATMHFPLKLEALNKGQTDLTITLKRIVQGQEDIQQRVVSIIVE